MPRIPRRYLPDPGVYHVTARGVDGCPVVRDDDDRRLFVAMFGETVRQQQFLCHAFCLMDNHYHLLVETALGRLSAGLHRLNGVYAQRFNRRHGRTGHLFGDRFAAWVVETDEHLANACEYVVLNPVRAGLCERPEDWPWSGLRAR